MTTPNEDLVSAEATEGPGHFPGRPNRMVGDIPKNKAEGPSPLRAHAGINWCHFEGVVC